MSLGPAQAETAVPSPDKTSLLARFEGIVIRPRSTLAAVAMHPRAAGMLALLTLLSFGAMAGFLVTDVGEVALVDQWERTALAFGQTVDDTRFAQMQRLSRYGVTYAAASAVARGPFLAVAIAAVLFGVLSARGGTFAQTLAVVSHAGVILTLRDVAAAPLNYLRESLASPATFVSFAGMLDEGSSLARFLALLDVFVLWWIVVLGMGLAALYRIRARTAMAALFGVYLGIALLLAGTMAVLGG